MKLGSSAVLVAGLISVLSVISISDGNAEDEVPTDDEYARNMDAKFSLGIAAGFARFDTNFNLT